MLKMMHLRNETIMPLMESADTNRDGELDRDEVQTVFGSLFSNMTTASAVVRVFCAAKKQCGNSARQWKLVWHAFDTNGDGRLSKVELLNLEQVLSALLANAALPRATH